VRAVQRLVEYAPSTGGLALWVHHRRLAAEEDAAWEDGDSPVWTDGSTLHYHAAFSRLALPLQAGWVAHQVLHIALRHAQRCQALAARLGDVDERLFNTCADAIVNSALAHLGWLELPADAVRLPPLLAATLALEQDDDTALAQWDVERLYLLMDDRSPPSPGRQRRDGPRAARTRAFGGQGRLDLRPNPGARQAPETESEQAREWAERLQRAHAGDGAMSLLRALLADVPKSRTPWEQLLRTQAARALAQQPALSWSRPSRSWLANQGRLRGGAPGTAPRRLPWEPGQTATRNVPRLVLVVDVSGSIDDALLQRFGREIEALARRLAAGLVLVVGDDHVQQVLHHRPGRTTVAALLQALRFEGGGTDFTPLLEEAARHAPDLVVVLTDLDGPARSQPRCPVLWAVPEAHAAARAPFGRKLVLA
jgi:predicted metal-dependent peptidase